jgi:hypothetical protein
MFRKGSGKEPNVVATERQTSVQPAAEALLEGDEVRVERSAVGVIRGATVDLSQGVVGLVLAQGDVSVSQGGARSFLAGGDLRITRGGGGVLAAGGDASIREGGVGTMLTLGDVTIQRGGVAVSVSRRLEVRDGAFVGFALSLRTEVGTGGRVLISAREAALAGIAAAIVGVSLVGFARALRGRRG